MLQPIDQWQQIRVQTDLQSYPVQLGAISRPAGLEPSGPCRDNLEALQKLEPPLQSGIDEHDEFRFLYTVARQQQPTGCPLMPTASFRVLSTAFVSTEGHTQKGTVGLIHNIHVDGNFWPATLHCTCI
jgi:hypothetical protein